MNCGTASILVNTIDARISYREIDKMASEILHMQRWCMYTEDKSYARRLHLHSIHDGLGG